MSSVGSRIVIFKDNASAFRPTLNGARTRPKDSSLQSRNIQRRGSPFKKCDNNPQSFIIKNQVNLCLQRCADNAIQRNETRVQDGAEPMRTSRSFGVAREMTSGFPMMKRTSSFGRRRTSNNKMTGVRKKRIPPRKFSEKLSVLKMNGMAGAKKISDESTANNKNEKYYFQVLTNQGAPPMNLKLEGMMLGAGKTQKKKSARMDYTARNATSRHSKEWHRVEKEIFPASLKKFEETMSTYAKMLDRI
eukprot:CAMPEP_0114488504 /NCGR_PEP_ID=MMETSP0109-20121206/1368_1 /TAXON_ID=29199 /ORGANISM="Chlorarachnion reptans, Strain CCCM449" /LENGTH=246 /DNA_ID=CAMNT_0001664907 /DNA_START=326 /DNA_END=1066 /DNA_ORIENTATION=-